jgi:hypothetical protein
VVCPHGAARLQKFVQHLNSLGHTIKFAVEVEDNDNRLPFLDVLVMKSDNETDMGRSCSTHVRITCVQGFEQKPEVEGQLVIPLCTWKDAIMTQILKNKFWMV